MSKAEPLALPWWGCGCCNVLHMCLLGFEAAAQCPFRSACDSSCITAPVTAGEAWYLLAWLGLSLQAPSAVALRNHVGLSST